MKCSLTLRSPIYPVLAGTATSQSFLADLSWLSDWRRSSVLQGGYWTGTFTLTGRDIGDAFETWMGADFEERSGPVTWQGLVYEMELAGGGVVRRRSFADMWNRVKATYTDMAGAEQVTAWADDLASQAAFGIKEQILNLGAMLDTAAESARDSYLAEYAWPWPRPLSFSASQQRQLRVTVCGYAFTANWRYASTASVTEYIVGAGGGADTCPDHSVATFQLAGDQTGTWGPYESTPGGSKLAHYLMWVEFTAISPAYTRWAYLGEVKLESDGNTHLHVYTDELMSTNGWNGGAAPTHGHGGNYKCRGTAEGLDEAGNYRGWIRSLVTNDCQYLSVGNLAENLLPVKRDEEPNIRPWDAIQSVVEQGDSAGHPWRCWVGNGRLVHYAEVSSTPNLMRREDWLDRNGHAMNPWQLTPGVCRDLSWRLSRAREDYWLPDPRDFLVEEFEVGGRGEVTPRIAGVDRSETLIYQLQAMWRGAGGKTVNAPNPYKGFNTAEDYWEFQDWWSRWNNWIQLSDAERAAYIAAGGTAPSSTEPHTPGPAYGPWAPPSPPGWNET